MGTHGSEKLLNAKGHHHSDKVVDHRTKRFLPTTYLTEVYHLKCTKNTKNYWDIKKTNKRKSI